MYSITNMFVYLNFLYYICCSITNMTEKEQEILYQNIGNNIKGARNSISMSQQTFASMLNLSRVSIVNIEKGRQRATIHLLYEISKITEIPISEILPKIETVEELMPKWQKKLSSQLDEKNGNSIEKVSDFLKKILNEQKDDQKTD